MINLLRLVAIFAPLLTLSLPVVRAAPARDYPVVPVPLAEVTVSDDFWRPRLETNRRVTLWYDFHKCEETGRIDNFAKAGGLMDGTFRGIYFNDSDVYKVIEGAAYVLASQPDPKLDAYLDALIKKIAAAQEPDGYLYTHRTILGEQTTGGAGKTRWSHLVSSHELYNVGHLYEAAVAHYLATGKRSLLEVAVKNADLIRRTFGPDKLRDIPGHEEIELGLVKLFRVTGNAKYLDLAEFFLDERGRAHGRTLYGEALQDHKPVVDQDQAVGHAVRAGYLYSAMADVAALTGQQQYAAALDKLWHDVVGHKMSITGGVGARRHGEQFGAPYELPNREAYNETCAAIANALWNHRMFLARADGKYIDVLERVIYNGFLSGVALRGDRFFYPNPLAHDGRSPFNQGQTGRSPWFGTSCCPVNVVRFLPSIAGYIYAHQDNTVYVNLFATSKTRVELPAGTVALAQQTDYPWDGRVRIDVAPDQPAEFALRVRIPGWARNQLVPSDLYRYLQPSAAVPTIAVNGAPVELALERGFAVIERRWTRGDTVELNLPMPIRRVVAHRHVEADAGRVAIERGPIVYCVEAVDNGGAALNLSLPDNAPLAVEHRSQLLGGVTVVRGPGRANRRDEAGKVTTSAAQLTAIPYYAWANRAVGEMTVWLPRQPALAAVAVPPTIASAAVPTASHVGPADTTAALNDQLEPARSYDPAIPRFTWWDHRGSTEWVQYEFPRPTRIAAASVYWFDDTGHGACRVPRSWRLLYREGERWRPVAGASSQETAADRFNEIRFEPVTTGAVRIEAELQPGFSAGLLEWKVK